MSGTADYLNKERTPSGRGPPQQSLAKPNSQKSAIDCMFPSVQSSEFIVDFEIQKIQNKKTTNDSFFNDFQAILNISNACKQATKRSTNKNTENCNKLAVAQRQFMNEKLEHQLLKIKSQNRDKQAQCLNKQRDQLKKVNENIVQQNTRALAEKDKVIKNNQRIILIEKEQSLQSLKEIRQFAKKILDAMNFPRKNNEIMIKFNQNDDLKSVMDQTLNKINEKMIQINEFKKMENQMSGYLQKSIQITENSRNTANFAKKQGNKSSIFLELRSEIKKKDSSKSTLTQLQQLLGAIELGFESIQGLGFLALEQKQKQIDKIKIDFVQMQTSLNQQTTKCKGLDKKLEITETGLQQTKILLESANKDISRLKSSLQAAQGKIRQFEKEITDLKNRHKIAIDQIQSYKKNIQDLNKKLNTKDLQLKSTEVKLQDEKEQKRKKVLLLQQKESEIENLKKNLRQTEAKLQDQKKKSERYVQQNNQRGSIIMERQSEMQKAKREIQNLKANNSSLNSQLRTKTNQLKDIESDMRHKNAKITDLQREIHETLKPNIQRMDKALKLAQGQKIQALTMYKQIIDNPPREQLQFFNGQILNISNRDYLKWFVNKLQENTHQTIRSTRLLYRYDLKNKQPFHTYIDSNPFIVLLVKIWNGQIIAGYSKPAFIPRSNTEFQEGHMFALRNKKVFKTKKEATNKYNQTKPRPITYDEFFLIWGNSDIRIKSGTNELFSSYGTANASYEEVGNEEPVIDDLFQIPDRETPLADYELFVIEFDK